VALEAEVQRARRLEDAMPEPSRDVPLETPRASALDSAHDAARSPATPPAPSTPDEYLDAYIASVQAHRESHHYRLLVQAYVVELLPRIAPLAQSPGVESSLRHSMIEFLGDKQLHQHPEAMDALLAVVPTDTEDHLISRALTSLRSIGDARAVPRLEQSIWSLRSSALQHAAIAVLVALADDRVHESLHRLLLGARDDSARQAVLFHLDPDRPSAALAVFELAASQSPSVRLQAAHKIREFYDSTVVEFIPRWLGFERDRTVRAILESAQQRPGGIPDWHARQAVGPPNADPAKDDPKAWASTRGDMGEQWIELDYKPARRGDTIRIFEVNSAGAVVAVDATDETGEVHTLWAGVDPTLTPGVFEIRVSPSSYRIRSLSIVLDTDLRPGWNEIDCVELIGPDGRAWASDARASSWYGGR
jgi:hypothetical protein